MPSFHVLASSIPLISLGVYYDVSSKVYNFPHNSFLLKALMNPKVPISTIKLIHFFPIIFNKTNSVCLLQMYAYF